MSYIWNLDRDRICYNMGGGGTSKTTVTNEMSPEQRQLLSGVLPIAQGYLANPPKQYPGTGIVGFQPNQLMAQQMTVDAANRMAPTLGRLPGQVGATMGAYDTLRGQENFLTSGDVLRASSNPYL